MLSIYVIIVLGEEKEGHVEKQFLEIIVENSPNLMKDRNLQIQKAQCTLYRINLITYIIIKPLTDKEKKILTAAGEK